MEKPSRLVNAKKMMQDARAGKYAVAHINTNNMEWAQAIIEAAQETSTPVIIGVSEGAVKYQWGFKTVVAMINAMLEYKNVTVPVALHLDHGSYDGAIEAIRAGFSSVMFDGSHVSFDENIRKTSEILLIAEKFNVSVEAEIGGIGGEEDGVASMGEKADVDQCAIMSHTGITMLAAGIGNIHGVYPPSWKSLDFDILAKINVAANKPLVLHGGTGIPDDQVKKAINLGVAKVNVNTECQLAYAEAIAQYIKAGKHLDMNKKGYDPRKVIKPGFEAIKKVCIDKFKLFGSLGKAIN